MIFVVLSRVLTLKYGCIMQPIYKKIALKVNFRAIFLHIPKKMTTFAR